MPTHDAPPLSEGFVGGPSSVFQYLNAAKLNSPGLQARTQAGNSMSPAMAADVEKQPLLSVQAKANTPSPQTGVGGAVVKAGPVHYAGLSITTIVILYYALCSSTMLVSRDDCCNLRSGTAAEPCFHV